jgi:hypothetical protein
MDPPEQILKEALENHYNMIKQFKGELSDRCIDVTVISACGRALEKPVVAQLLKRAQQFMDSEGSLPFHKRPPVALFEPEESS